MAGGTLRGDIARLTWGYFEAATIRGYTVTRTGKTFALRATVITSNAYNLRQRPLMFAAWHATGEWRWPVLDYTLTDGQLMATLGPEAPG